MNTRKKLRIFRTVYLWIFVIKVLHARGERFRGDTNAISTETEADVRNGAGGVLIKPLTLQLFNDYTDELVNERGNNVIATTLPPATLWQTIDKHLYTNRLPLVTTNFKTIDNNNDNKHDKNTLTSKEINFENFNDFVRSNINSNALWPKVIHWQHLHHHQQHLYPYMKPLDNDIQTKNEQQRHSLSHIYVQDVERNNANRKTIGKQQMPAINIRHKVLPLFIEKYFKTKYFKPTTTSRTLKAKKSKSYSLMANNNKNNDDNDNGQSDDDVNMVVSVRDAAKENLFPLKDDEESSDTFLNVNVNDSDDEDGIANSKGNGNESLNYNDNSILNSNYLLAHSNNDIDRELYLLDKLCDKRAKPSMVGHPPFLPAISGGAMTNLGKFFRDLSKNVHFSEQYQWSGEHQKLLEGDPNFSNIQHHLEKPNAATDQQTAEWIKAIRFYRPSQKIRSLVAMNPHGNWDHSSQFIDPNYMWVGLGK